VEDVIDATDTGSAVTALAVAVAVALTFGVAWMAGHYLRIRRQRLLIGSAMVMYGITPADAEAAGLGRAFERAADRCAQCGQTDKCRSWLTWGRRGQLEAACPKAAFFKSVRRSRKVQEAEVAP